MATLTGTTFAVDALWLILDLIMTWHFTVDGCKSQWDACGGKYKDGVYQSSESNKLLWDWALAGNVGLVLCPW